MIREGGTDVALLSLGTHLSECEAAADILEGEGFSVSIADARFAKPLDMELIAALAKSHRALITVEQGAMGGFGLWCCKKWRGAGLLDFGLRVRAMCLPDRFIDQASPDEMYRDAGLSCDDIVAKVRQTLGDRDNVVALDTLGQRGA